MISFSEILLLIYRYSMEKKSRIFLTISGIIIGIFTFTFFIFVSQGLSNAVAGQFSAFGLNVIAVQSVEDSNSNGPPSGSGLTDTEIEKIKQVTSGYIYVAPAIFASPIYEYGRQSSAIVSLSYPDKYWELVGEDLGLEISQGRMLKPGDSGVCVIGVKAAQTFSETNPLKLGSVLKVEGKSLRVIGIIKERGDLFVDSALLMSFDDIKEISGQDTYSIIRASFYDGVDLEVQKEAIDKKLNPNGDEKNVELTTPAQAIEQFNSILGILTLIISVVSTIALVVGGINVMNTMYSNVLERTNEISVFKAIGATNFDITKIFLIESAILGLIGAFIGFMLSYGLAETLSYIITNFVGFNVPVNFDWKFFLETLIITSFFATLFGTYPSVKAAKVNPADNLRDE